MAEYPRTAELIRRLRHVRRAGEFSRAEFLVMCRWKSPRALPLYRRHRAARIRRLARDAGDAERGRRMELLTALAGVSVPVASAILTLIDPRRYGVLDIRVWQLLWALGAVDRRPSGRGFTVVDWLRYLETLRGARAATRRLGARGGLTLFERHRRAQRGGSTSEVGGATAAPRRPQRSRAAARCRVRPWTFRVVTNQAWPVRARLIWSGGCRRATP